MLNGNFVIAFLAGSIPFGLIVSKLLFKVDIRDYGSKNIGATNMYRILGKKASFVVLILDLLKGSLAALLGSNNKEALLLSSLAILGHIFSPWLKFKGGKGIATAIGCYVVLFPFHVLFGSLIWFCIFKKTKISAMASLITFFIIGQTLWFLDIDSGIFGTFCSVLFLISHRDNIQRIIYKNELSL